MLTFPNSKDGIQTFLSWLPDVEQYPKNIIIGIEGGGSSRHALLANLLQNHVHIYEVNPLFTKQRRTFGTRTDKSDPRDAKLIAEVLTRKLSDLPRITVHDLSSHMLVLRKTVWFYEQLTAQAVAIKNQLHQLHREHELSLERAEKETLHFLISERKKELRHIEKTQRTCTKQLSKLLEKQGKNLTTIKGMQTRLAARIVAHSGGIERFKNIDDFVQYAGIAPKEKSSGRTQKHKKARGGNRKLNSAFYLAALLQMRWNPRAKEYFEQKLKEGKTKSHALKCLMKGTACIVYGMLRSGEDYRG